MEKSNHSMNSIELAKKIISEIEADDCKVDILTRWMVHECSDLLICIENEKDESLKLKYKEQCRQLIIHIWDVVKNEYSYLNPICNIKETLAVINALKISPSGLFKYLNFNKKIEGDLPTLVAITKQTAERMVDICVLWASLEDKFENVKEWKEIEGALEPEEKDLFEQLELLLSGHRYVNISSGIAIKVMNTDDRNSYMLNKLQLLINQQQDGLNALALKFKKD